MNVRLSTVLPIVSVMLGAGWWGWRMATHSPPENDGPETKATAPRGIAQAIKSADGQSALGDPLASYQRAKSKEEKLEAIGQFMALGHEQNPLMLIAALKDRDQEVRIRAVEYSASLEAGVSAQVLLEGCLNDSPDVREMSWSLLAPHPIENKATVFMAAIERGTDMVLEEAFMEMGRTPEMPLFEAMLTAASRTQGSRQERVFKELKEWLIPGGNEGVPSFNAVAPMITWWSANKHRYDQFMLRIDQ